MKSTITSIDTHPAVHLGVCAADEDRVTVRSGRGPNGDFVVVVSEFCDDGSLIDDMMSQALIDGNLERVREVVEGRPPAPGRRAILLAGRHAATVLLDGAGLVLIRSIESRLPRVLAATGADDDHPTTMSAGIDADATLCVVGAGDPDPAAVLRGWTRGDVGAAAAVTLPACVDFMMTLRATDL